MPEFKDWQDYKARHPAQFPAPGRTPHSPEALGDLTTKSRSVVAHPGWQLFLDRLASRQDALTKSRDALQRDMMHGPALGHELDLLKLSIQVIEGEIAGLEFAASIIPSMLEAGEQMIKELTSGPLAHAGAMTQGKP